MKIALILVLVCAIGAILGYFMHPYERCTHGYDSVFDVSECIWILKNP